MISIHLARIMVQQRSQSYPWSGLRRRRPVMEGARSEEPKAG